MEKTDFITFKGLCAIFPHGQKKLRTLIKKGKVKPLVDPVSGKIAHQGQTLLFHRQTAERQILSAMGVNEESPK